MKKCKICNKNYKNTSSLSAHIYQQHNISIKEYVLKYIHFGIKPKCKCGCGKYTNFNRGKFSNYIKGHRKIDQYEIDKRKKTNLKKYGTKCPLQNEDIRKKTKNTKKEKYNNENYTNIEKRKNTNIKKYGVKHPLQSKEIQNKKSKTNLKKYGIEYPQKLEKIKDKAKQTNLKKYGVKYTSQSKNIKEKIQYTYFKKFINNLFTTNRLKNKVIPLFNITEYNGTKNKIYKFKCKKCNKIFYGKLDNGRIPRCLVCYPINQPISNTEKEITEYINSIYTEKIIENDRKILNGKELDIYLPDKNLAIECNGLYYHSEISGNKDKNYHLNKTILCENKGIRLIHIFEDEWINKQEIVKNKLKNLLGLSTEKIYARKCEIQETNTQIKNNFLDNYHIQGQDKSKIKLGLFFEKELVAIMTFGKRRLALGKKNSEKNEYELLRYATSKNVVGGAGKLLSYFIKNYNPVKIISYADRRWSQGNLYEKLSFSKIHESMPNYWYIKNGQIKKFHRFNFRKNVLNKKLEKFDDNLTEWQNMQLNSYDRIWDCGNLKYEWKFNL